MPVLYDNININKGILFDLPFREGTGIVTHDIAKPHHPMVMVNTPTWIALDSGVGVLYLNGTNEYLECDTADCVDLDFTTEDYSVGGWINWLAGEASQIVIGRYEVSNSGWEVYLYTDGASINYLTLRHHHAAGATERTASYSDGWTQGVPWLWGISRSGATAQHYRNGVAVETTHSVGGLIDPETCDQDLVIGTRYTKDANYYKGGIWRPRIWNKVLTEDDWLLIYERERWWFI